MTSIESATKAELLDEIVRLDAKLAKMTSQAADDNRCVDELDYRLQESQQQLTALQQPLEAAEAALLTAQNAYALFRAKAEMAEAERDELRNDIAFRGVACAWCNQRFEISELAIESPVEQAKRHLATCPKNETQQRVNALELERDELKPSADAWNCLVGAMEALCDPSDANRDDMAKTDSFIKAWTKQKERADAAEAERDAAADLTNQSLLRRLAEVEAEARQLRERVSVLENALAPFADGRYRRHEYASQKDAVAALTPAEPEGNSDGK